MIADSYIERLENLIATGGRRILGIAGAPGSGKSTLAEALAKALPGRAIVVPMDGYHLANIELERLGRASRKGAEDTFDSAGFVALLRRLREQRPDETVYAPLFRREIEEPIANAIPVLPDVPLVITEGNYLLLDQGHWSKVRGLLDEAWYVDVDPALRTHRLVERHIAFGRDEAAARQWVASTDEPNAVLIDSTRPRANVLFQWA